MGEGLGPFDGFAGGGVDEAELGGVEHDAVAGDDGCFVVSDVDFFADDGVACFAEVDADLVGAAGLDAAGDEGGAEELFLDGDVGDGFAAELFAGLVDSAFGDGAADAVAGVADESAADGLGFHGAVDDGAVLALDGVGAELLGEAFVGFG